MAGIRVVLVLLLFVMIAYMCVTVGAKKSSMDNNFLEDELVRHHIKVALF